MNRFSISDLQQFSGIKSHTIRIWEQRYNGLHPTRSEGNTRYYDGEQLRRLLNIVSLSKAGHKISTLCKASNEELLGLASQQLNSLDPSALSDEYYIGQLIAAGMNYDEISFDKVLSSCILKYGMSQTYIKVIYPLLVRVGVMWSVGSLPPSQEHFISNLLKQKLYTATDGISYSSNKNNKWLLFLPENELHELGLLFSNYLLRSMNASTIYLGANLPLDTLIAAVKESGAQNLLFFWVSGKDVKDANTYISKVTSSLPETNIHIGCNKTLGSQLDLRKNDVLICEVETLRNTVAQKQNNNG